MPETVHPRSIRSFVTRAGRITAAQQRAADARAVHLDPEVVAAGMRLGQRHEVLAVTEADLERARRAAPERGGQLERSRTEIDAVLRPQRRERALAAGGTLHLATDWEPYAQEMRAVLGAAAELENLAPGGGFSTRPPERLPTRFERRGVRLGHEVWDLAFRRRT